VPVFGFELLQRLLAQRECASAATSPEKVAPAGGIASGTILPVRGRARAFAAAALASIASTGCGPKQVCECAALAGGMPPATEDEAAFRSREVAQCLARHGGGTTTGYPVRLRRRVPRRCRPWPSLRSEAAAMAVLSEATRDALRRMPRRASSGGDTLQRYEDMQLRPGRDGSVLGLDVRLRRNMDADRTGASAAAKPLTPAVPPGVCELPAGVSAVPPGVCAMMPRAPAVTPKCGHFSMTG
jgi:hypothetical protein